MKNDIIAELKKWLSDGNEIAIYCAGTHGVIYFNILNNLGIKISAFVDNDIRKIGNKVEGIKCIAPKEIAGNTKFKVIICSGIEKYKLIHDLAISQGIIDIIDFRKIIDDLIINYREEYLDTIIKQYSEIPADPFYTFEVESFNNFDKPNECLTGKIAVYTGLFGDYDDFIEPTVYPSNVDYYYISDYKSEKIKKCVWLNAETIIPENIISPIKRNRYVKMHPHLIFPNYRYSIYIDANIQIIKDPTEMICESVTGISGFHHPKRDCLYYEALTVVNHKRVDPMDIVKQIKRYLTEGMPIHFGLTELPFIAREHNKKKCIDIMETWWEEFDCGAQRDQISFPYALWKNKVSVQDIAILGNNVRDNEYLCFRNHYNESKRIKNTI